MSSSGYFPFEVTGEVAYFIAEKSARAVVEAMRDDESTIDEKRMRLTHLFVATAIASIFTTDDEQAEVRTQEGIFKHCLVIAGCPEDTAGLVSRVTVLDSRERRMHASLSYVPEDAEGFGVEKARNGRSVDVAKFLLENFS